MGHGIIAVDSADRFNLVTEESCFLASSFLYKVVTALIRKLQLEGWNYPEIEMTSQRHQSINSETMIASPKL